MGLAVVGLSDDSNVKRPGVVDVVLHVVVPIQRIGNARADANAAPGDAHAHGQGGADASPSPSSDVGRGIARPGEVVPQLLVREGGNRASAAWDRSAPPGGREGRR